jgi:hypothetical protein
MATSEFPVPALSANVERLRGAPRVRQSASRAFYAASGTLAVSALLPWASVGGVYDVHLATRGIATLLAFAFALGAAGRLLQTRRPNRAVVIGAWLFNTLLGLFIIGSFALVDGTRGIASPGMGLFTACVTLCCAVVGAILLSRVRRADRRSAPPEAA